MSKDVFYSSSYINYDTITPFDRTLLVYLLSYYNFDEENSKNYLHLPLLYLRMFGREFSELSNRQQVEFRKKVEAGLESLVKDQILTYRKLSTRDDYEICKITKYRDDGYFIFPLEDVDKILQKTGSYMLVNYYLSLLKSRDFKLVVDDKQGVVGYMAIKFFVDKFGKSRKTIMNYNKQLEDLGVIYIRHSIAKGVPNAYGLMKHKKYVDSYFLRYTSHDKSKTVNRKRSLKQKYNATMENDELDYGAATMEEIEEYVKKQEEIFRNKNFCN